MNKRKQQAQATKERIYACADRLFREKGYDQTSVAEIAKAAGTSIGGFYHHFATKEEIMRNWMEEFDAQYRDYYENVLCGPEMNGLSVIEKIRLMMINANRIFSSHGYMLSSMAYSLMLRDERLGSFIVSPRRDYYQIVSELVHEAARQGALREGLDLAEVIQDFTVLCRGCMVEWILQDGEMDLLARIDKLLGAYLDSIVKPENK